ncbi:MAG TPA: hypothetical protein VF749_18705 [Candidatus Acidoferrum sp.]
MEAKLADGTQASMKLKREPGADGKGVVLENVRYFNATQNDGFQLYRSIEHRADLEGHQFSYSDRNAFLITIVSEEPKEPQGQSAGQQKAELEQVSTKGPIAERMAEKRARDEAPRMKEPPQRTHWVLMVFVEASQITAALRK